VAERTTHVYSTDTTSGDEQRVTHAFSTASSNAIKLFVTHVYATFTTVIGIYKISCPAIAVGVANILVARFKAHVVCPAIAAPIANIFIFKPPRNYFLHCPTIANPIAECIIEYKPFSAPFTGGAGITTAVLPRRQTVSTRALRRRRRRISRRR
jgi:hypothetical protein